MLAWAGFFATLVLSWLAGFAYWRGITRLRPAATLGALVAGRRRRLGALLGGLGHFALGTLGFPALYAVAFAIAGRADAPLGAEFGLAHGILAGLVLPAAWRAAGNSKSAGLLGWRLGGATPFGLLAGHVLYGALIGYIYVVPPA